MTSTFGQRAHKRNALWLVVCAFVIGGCDFGIEVGPSWGSEGTPPSGPCAYCATPPRLSVAPSVVRFLHGDSLRVIACAGVMVCGAVPGDTGGVQARWSVSRTDVVSVVTNSSLESTTSILIRPIAIGDTRIQAQVAGDSVTAYVFVVDSSAVRVIHASRIDQGASDTVSVSTAATFWVTLEDSLARSIRGQPTSYSVSDTAGIVLQPGIIPSYGHTVRVDATRLGRHEFRIHFLNVTKVVQVLVTP